MREQILKYIYTLRKRTRGTHKRERERKRERETEREGETETTDRQTANGRQCVSKAKNPEIERNRKTQV